MTLPPGHPPPREDLGGVAADDVPVIAPPRSAVKIVARFLIGLAVIAILLWRIGPEGRTDLVQQLRAARVAWVVLAAAVLTGALVVSSLRWKAYLDALELAMPLPAVIRLYFVGQFFNSFLPSGVGGDAYKAVRIGRRPRKIPEAIASTFLDRFAGFVALAAIGVLGALSTVILGSRGRDVTEVGLLLSTGMLAAASVLLVIGDRVARLFPEHGIGGKVRAAVGAIHAAGRHRDAAARGYLWGLVFQLMVLGCHALLLRALGLTGVGIGALTSVVVIGSLATLLPSPGGIGFRDAAYVWALTRFGIAHGAALGFALLFDAVLLATSAIGFVVYVAAGGDVDI